MNTLQEAPTTHEVHDFTVPTLPPSTIVVLDTTNVATPLLPPLPNANTPIVNVAPLEATKHEKPLTDTEAKNTLDDYAKAILDAHQNAENSDRLSKKSGREAITSAIKAGEYLVKAKELVGHGNWLPWLKGNCKGISDKTAQRYMTLAKFDNVSNLEQCTSLRQAYICSGGLAPDRLDKPPEEKNGEAVEPTADANTPDIILPQMQRGFALLQKQYDTLVKSNPKLQTHLLSVCPPGELTLLEMFQRWQYPLGDAFDYFKLPSIEVVCVRCGHVREPDEFFIPIHHWAPEYKQRHEWCEQCANDCNEYIQPDEFDISKEIKLLIENLNELKSLSAKDYNLAQKVNQLQQIKIAEPDIITAAENNVWMPTDLDNEESTIEEIRRLSPKIIVANNDATKALWNIYRHFVSSAVNNLPPTRNVRFLVVDDSKPNQPVLGIGNISGDFLALGERDKFIGWTAEQRNAGKLKHTAVGSTIIATQPFGSNFNGGKLIAALITSQAIRDEWKSLTGCLLAGLTTTSLFGVPSMYDQIKQWKRLGLTTGRVPIQPRMDIYKQWKKFVQATRTHELNEVVKRDVDDTGPVTNEKSKVMTLIFKAAGLRLGDYEHGHSRGIYFSEFYENTKDFLCGKVAESELVLKPLFQESIEQITERWRTQAIKRYRNLKQEGKLNPQKQSYSQLGQMNFEDAQKAFLVEEGE